MTVPTVLVRRAIVTVEFTPVTDKCFANRPVAGGGDIGGCCSGCGGSGVEGGQSDPRVTVGGDCGTSLTAIVRGAFDVITAGITTPSYVISAGVSTPADVICAGVMLLSDTTGHVHSDSSAGVTPAGVINPIKYGSLVTTSADAVCLDNVTPDDITLHASCDWLGKISTHVVSPADVICLADVIIPADVVVSTHVIPFAAGITSADITPIHVIPLTDVTLARVTLLTEGSKVLGEGSEDFRDDLHAP